MPQLTRLYCSRCQNSIFNTFIGADGLRATEGAPGAKRVPLALYFVVGQPADTGESLDINGDGVCVPAFIREIMQEHVPVKRAELCMVCIAEVFGTPCITAVDDNMYSVEQQHLTTTIVGAVLQDAATSETQKAATAMDRVFEAILVGRGAQAALPLPPVTPVLAAPVLTQATAPAPDAPATSTT